MILYVGGKVQNQLSHVLVLVGGKVRATNV
jgi:hypothetical protein